MAIGKVDRVRWLLDEQPSLAKTTRGGETALFCLPDSDEALAIELAELLLFRGADARLKNSSGLTAADAAERKGMDALAELLRASSSGGQ